MYAAPPLLVCAALSEPANPVGPVIGIDGLGFLADPLRLVAVGAHFARVRDKVLAGAAGVSVLVHLY